MKEACKPFMKPQYRFCRIQARHHSGRHVRFMWFGNSYRPWHTLSYLTSRFPNYWDNIADLNFHRKNYEMKRTLRHPLWYIYEFQTKVKFLFKKINSHRQCKHISKYIFRVQRWFDLKICNSIFCFINFTFVEMSIYKHNPQIWLKKVYKQL